ncbi:MAG TPA: antitoxin family protein [Pyrinomonadaceae bacterium]|nr:antitoxin family protein [Pyrinomonadaceae bacterium]
MSQTLKAIYRDGAFVPQSPCDLPEGVEVELTINAPHIIPAKVKDPEERKRLMSELIQNMLDNPIPENAPRFTREELHERR